MNLKKIFCTGLAAAMFFSVPVLTYAADSATDKLVQIEIDTYGSEQVGAVINRIGKLEKDFSGKNFQGNMNARIDAVYDNLYSNTGKSSVISKLNALEWNFYHEVSGDDIEKRISKLESVILGKQTSGGFSDRLQELSKASFGSGDIPMTKMQIPENTLIKIALVDSVTTRTLQIGDSVKVKVAEDVIIDGNLIFAKGLIGSGKVVNVRKAKGWTGRNGKVEIDFNELRTIEGQKIETFVGMEAREKMIMEEMAEGASLVAMNLNDDWNKVLVHGKNIDAKPGTELYIQTKNSNSGYVLVTDNGALKVSTNLTPEKKVVTKRNFEDDEENFYLDDEE